MSIANTLLTADEFAVIAHDRPTTLMPYVLVAQDQVDMECYSPDPRGWILTDAQGIDQSLHVPGADITLTLAEAYAQVEFPPTEGVG